MTRELAYIALHHQTSHLCLISARTVSVMYYSVTSYAVVRSQVMLFIWLGGVAGSPSVFLPVMLEDELQCCEDMAGYESLLVLGRLTCDLVLMCRV